MAVQASSSGVDSLVEMPGRLRIQSDLAISEVVEQELIFLEMLTRCFRKSWKAGYYSDLRCSVTSLYKILIQEEDLLEKYESISRKDCAVLLDSLKSISWPVEEILKFIVCLVWNLRRLSSLKAEIFVSVKNQIMILIEKFSLLEILLCFFVKYFIEPQELKNYLDNHVMNWVHDAATLSLMWLLKGKEENMPQTLETTLSDLLHKVMPCSTQVIEMFIKLLKDSKRFRSGKLQAGQTVAALVDFLLEGVIEPLKEYVAIFRDGLIFMITFLMDPPPEEPAGGRLFTQIDVVVNEVLSHILSSCMDELKVDISVGGKHFLSSLQYKIDEVKIEIRKLIHVQVSYPQDFNFPAINSLWFIDSFLENIKEMVKPSSMIAFARHQIVIVQEELLFLRAFLKDIMELQKEREELRDIWNKIMNTVFLAESAIASCSFVDHPIWYDMLWLFDVIQEIKLVKSEVEKHNCQVYNAKMTSTNTSFSDVHMKQANHASLLQDDVVVGMEDESKKIIEKLTRGTKQLAIVSIVGMPGLGKTTMARKVYNDPSVKGYFYRHAWCCVSQVYNCRALYFDLLSDVIGVDAHESYSDNSDDDLAEKLRKSLKGQKYLVVFDDIWSIEAWNSLKQSFPDDHKGSRIVFTSRILDLVSQAELNCIHLRTLTNEESRDLFLKKLSPFDSSPPDDRGKIVENIVRNCQGVPLAVVLVAGVLADTNLEFWKEVEESTVSGVVGERYRDIVELSYKHLPDHLKPCFLYFGAFPEDRVIRSEEMMNLWIGEGFIPRSDKKSVYKVAETYLSDLVRRSLVIIAERSYSGGIEACRVHDLLRDLCLVKMKEENFLQVVQKNGVCESSLNHPKGYGSYRLSIGSGWLDSLFMEPESPFVRSIICGSATRMGHWKYFKGLFNVSLFERFKLVYVLDLEGTKKQIDFDGAGISFMVHLRYLSIHRIKSRHIPESIGNLWNLETLIVRKWIRRCTLPSRFWKMKSLRYVHIGDLDLSGIESHEFSELEYLETLENVRICSRDEMKELWRRSPRLRKLGCKVRLGDNIDFRRFTELETLTLNLYWEGKGKPFSIFYFPNSLKILTFDGVGVQWEAISTIRGLPNLEFLRLRAVEFGGEQKWEIRDDEFSKLKVLVLRFLDLKEWSIPDECNDPFPSLEQLQLWNCRSLEKIPSRLGEIPTLNKIELHYCFEALEASAMEILQQQQEMGNDGLQVYIHQRPQMPQLPRRIPLN